MIVALVVIITLSSVQMRENAGKWIEPVKDRLVQEELKSLEVRAYERAQLVSEELTGYKSSLEMVRNYTERLVDANGGLDLGNPLPAHFSANSMNSKGCPQGSLCRQARLEGCTRIVDAKTGEPARQVSVEYSLWSSPQQQIAPASNRCPGASGCPAKLHGMGAMSDEHSGRTTHLDNVARVAYFSTNTTYVYWGFEQDEVYRQFPYMDFSDTRSYIGGPMELILDDAET